jgi:hypothetical protein
MRVTYGLSALTGGFTHLLNGLIWVDSNSINLTVQTFSKKKKKKGFNFFFSIFRVSFF